MNVEALLQNIAMEYPEPLRKMVVPDIPRQVFQIETIIKAVGQKATVCDIGGGHSLFAPGCAALGLDTILMGWLDAPDTETDRLFEYVREKVHAKYGVRIIEKDVIENELGIEADSIDAFTSFAAIEHFHHSPKRLFASVARALRTQGVFFLGAPNCVNLRKRITVPLGYGKWSQMKDWYETEQFKGHVREPDVDDLLYILRDMGLTPEKAYGRNWIGHKHPNRVIRIGTQLLDNFLRLRPTLCSDIYVLGRKS